MGILQPHKRRSPARGAGLEEVRLIENDRHQYSIILGAWLGESKTA
jgi:hypothetical protein